MKRLVVVWTGCLLMGCGNAPKEPASKVTVPRLPEMGDPVITVPSFRFINQDGDTVTQEIVKNKVYIADFFFTTCPSICPKLANTLYLVQEKMKGEKDFMILSHTIDPDHDTPEVLKEYAAAKKADPAQWQFLTGDYDSLYQICEFGYMGWAVEDSTMPGGFGHTGFLVLVDQKKHIRAVYDGTRAELADSIVNDVKYLLHE